MESGKGLILREQFCPENKGNAKLGREQGLRKGLHFGR